MESNCGCVVLSSMALALDTCTVSLALPTPILMFTVGVAPTSTTTWFCTNFLKARASAAMS
jgi:hypothetical protein